MLHTDKEQTCQRIPLFELLHTTILQLVIYHQRYWEYRLCILFCAFLFVTLVVYIPKSSLFPHSQWCSASSSQCNNNPRLNRRFFLLMPCFIITVNTAPRSKETFVRRHTRYKMKHPHKRVKPRPPSALWEELHIRSHHQPQTSEVLFALMFIKHLRLHCISSIFRD